MHKKPGIIIRLIDLVLLILFGYLRIADMDIKEKIEVRHLAQGASGQAQTLVCVVHIKANQSLEVGSFSTDAKYRPVANLAELGHEIRGTASRADQLHQGFFVKLEADGDSRLQRIVDVIEACEQVSAERKRAGLNGVDYGL